MKKRKKSFNKNNQLLRAADKKTSQRLESLSKSASANVYENTIALIDQLSSKHHKLISKLLTPKHDGDLTPVQVILLYNINDKVVSVSELYSQNIYMGSNVSYNLKKLSRHGYVQITRSQKDKRIFLVSTTAKGQELRLQLQKFYQENMLLMFNTCPIDIEDLKKLYNTLVKLDRFWAQELYRLSTVRL